jgi:hypothetical protein
MTPTSRTQPLLMALAIGAITLSALNAVRLSALSAPAGLVMAASLPQPAMAMPVSAGDTSVPAASSVQFADDETPAAPTF